MPNPFISGTFADRHIGTDDAAQASMLAAVGYDSL